ncbi:MAG: acyltransferase [Balneolaceae bacterium]|nr:MAG: acyltransferase [Balneolaceae bacterium]
MNVTKIALPQYSCSENRFENQDTAEAMVAEAARLGADLILLQELFDSLYFCSEMNQDHFSLAETAEGSTVSRFRKLAASLNVVLLLPFFEKKAPGLYFNSLAVIERDGTLAGLYRKMHIPDDPGFFEKYYFTPGDLGFRVFHTSAGKIGTLICWDQWFPEAARLTAMKGAELLVYPTAIGTIPEEGEVDKIRFRDAWRTIQRSHAIANGCYVASTNRIGNEGHNTFWGGSFVCGPFGEILAEAGEGQEIISAELNWSLIENQRQTWPFFRDRRVDAFGKLTERYG